MGMSVGGGEPAPVNPTGGAPASDVNAVQQDAAGNPVTQGADGTTQRVDTGQSQIVQQSGDPSADKTGSGHNVPRNDSPVLPRPQQFTVRSGGSSNRNQQAGDAQQTQQTDATGQNAPLTQANRSSGPQPPTPNVDAPPIGPGSNVPANQPTAEDRAAIETLVDQLDLPPELKEAIKQEALAQLEQLGDAANIPELVEDLEAKANASQKAMGTLRSAQPILQKMTKLLKDGELTPAQAKQMVAELKELKAQIQDIGETEEPLTQELKELEESIDKFSNKLESSTPELKALKQQWTTWKESGQNIKDIKQQLESNIDNDPNLTPEQKATAKAAIQTWKGVATGDAPPLDDFAPGIAAALKSAHAGASRNLANLINGGLIRPDKFKAKDETDLDADVDTAALEKALAGATGGERFKISANYMVMMAKIMSFLALMKAQINALDGEAVQSMAEADRQDLQDKLGMAYEQIEKQLEQTNAQQRALVMEKGMSALTIIVAALAAALAIIAILSCGTLAGLVAAIIAAVVACLMFVIECSKQICKACGVDNVFQAIAKAAGDPEAAQKIEMIFGAVMAVASIGSIIGAAAKLAMQGAMMAIKMASKMGVEVVKGVSAGVAKTLAQQAPKLFAQTVVKQMVKEVVGASVRMVVTTAISMVVPLIATEIAKAAAPDDEEAQMILQILLSIILMIGVMAGGMIGGKAISGGFKGPGALAAGKDTFRATLDAGAEAAETTFDQLSPALKFGLKVKAFFKAAGKAMSEFVNDPTMGYRDGGRVGATLERGARMMQATAMLSSAVISMKQAQYRLEAAEAAQESEVIQGLIDILNALRKVRQGTKDGLIEDLKEGINELVAAQAKHNNEMYQSASRVLSEAFS